MKPGNADDRSSYEANGLNTSEPTVILWKGFLQPQDIFATASV